MKLLAIDTALGAVSACVIDSGSPEPLWQETMDMDVGHAEALLPLVDRVVSRVDRGFEALGRVAVTVGPGSFTGIRVGIAAARAFGLACKAPVVGVSTLSAIAAPLMLEAAPGVVVASIDARHGNVYVQAFAASGRTLLPARLLPFRDAVRALGSGPFRLAGSGSAMLAVEAWSIGLQAEVAGRTGAPDIAFVARLGLLADPDNALPRPLYLKEPDAKPQDAARLSRAAIG